MAGKYYRKNSKKYSIKRKKGRSRTPLIVIIALIAVYAVFAAYCFQKTGALVPTGELIDGRPTFRFIDVGQGDCVLVTYKGESVLVDSGPASSGKTTAEYLMLYSPNIDYFFVTHPHEDHMGGAAEIISSTNTEHFVLSTLESGENFYTDALEAAENRGTEVIRLEDGAVFDTGNITVTVLDVFDFFSDDFNNSSLILKIEADGNTLLVTGDAEVEEEEYLLANFSGELKADILKAGHHGSHTSTSEEFLEAVSPEFAVISCGLNNSYGHPSSEVLKRLESHGIKIRRTDKQGTIILRGSGR